MAGAKNIVLEGEYKGKAVGSSGSAAYIILGFVKNVKINKDTVESYEVMDEAYSKSAASAVGRGLIGAFLLGPIGAVAAVSAKTKGVHIIAIKFKDGTKSLLEVDDAKYKAIMRSLF